MGRYNSETEITLTKSELLALLFKLDVPSSAKSLLRKGEDGKEYLIRAITDEDGRGKWLLHPREKLRIAQYLQWESQQ